MKREKRKKKFNPMIIPVTTFAIDTVFLGLPILKYAEENLSLKTPEILIWSFGKYTIFWIILFILLIEILVYIVYDITR